MEAAGAGDHREFNDWFPHISPDGKWIAYISFPADISGRSSLLQTLLPAVDADRRWYPEVIAYIYGGQGTINVPSWSPDGRRLAFVSNTDVIK